MTRKSSAGSAAAIQPITERSTSTTCAEMDSATAHTSTAVGKRTGLCWRLRRRISSPDAMDIKSKTTASAHASHPPCPWEAATSCTWAKLAAPAAAPIASMMMICTIPSIPAVSVSGAYVCRAGHSRSPPRAPIRRFGQINAAFNDQRCRGQRGWGSLTVPYRGGCVPRSTEVAGNILGDHDVALTQSNSRGRRRGRRLASLA